MTTCYSCGTPNRPRARFCRRCGRSLSLGATSSYLVGLWLAGLILALILFAVGLALLWFGLARAGLFSATTSYPGLAAIIPNFYPFGITLVKESTHIL